MTAEQETLAHRVLHHPESAHRDGETQLVIAYPGAYRRVKQPKETTMSLARVLDHGHRYHRTASRTELGYYGIGFVTVVESPAAQPR